MEVSQKGYRQSSILIGFSIANHSYWGTPIPGTPNSKAAELKVKPIGLYPELKQLASSLRKLHSQASCFMFLDMNHSLPAAFILLSGGEKKICNVPLPDLPEFQVSARYLAMGGFWGHFPARLPFFEHFEFDLGVQQLVVKSAPLTTLLVICNAESLRILK